MSHRVAQIETRDRGRERERCCDKADSRWRSVEQGAERFCPKLLGLGPIGMPSRNAAEAR